MGKLYDERRGFTLIELLVVIAIIAILAAILFPVFTSAKRKGQQANCQGNLKQLGTAAQTYLADWGDFRGLGGGFSTDDPMDPWIGSQGGHFWWPYDDSARYSPIAKYVKNTGILVCPMDKGAILIDHKRYKMPQGVRKVPAWSYTFNNPFGADKPDTFSRLSKIGIWVEENIDVKIEKEKVDPPEPNMINDWAFAGSDITSFKHNGQANVLFADGHVKALPGGLACNTAKWPGTNHFIFKVR